MTPSQVSASSTYFGYETRRRLGYFYTVALHVIAATGRPIFVYQLQRYQICTEVYLLRRVSRLVFFKRGEEISSDWHTAGPPSSHTVTGFLHHRKLFWLVAVFQG